MKLRIALFQMDIAEGKPEINEKKAEEAASSAKQKGCDFLVFPEYWATGFDLQQTPQLAENLHHGFFRTMSVQAREKGIGIIGSGPRKREGLPANTAVMVNNTGQIIGQYDKMHLFSLMEEDRIFHPGETLHRISTPWGDAGLLLCFDLRFPEASRRLVLDGARILFVPAYWPSPRLETWRTLLRARAMENQVYVVGCNRSRQPGGINFGYSAVVDPSGEVLIEAGLDEVLLTVDVDIENVGRIRELYPFLSCRRPDSYGHF